MDNVHCYTSVSYSYLDRARVLAETVRKQHPTWTLWLLLSDEAPEGFHFDIAEEAFDHVVALPELGIPNWKQWAFGHDVVELCTAVKGAMLCRLLEHGADAVVYLDPDTAVFAPLDDVLNRLQHSSVVLTPHVIQAENTLAGVIDNEIGSLKHGVYNLGFVAVSNSPAGNGFAQWWRDRLLKFCHDDVPMAFSLISVGATWYRHCSNRCMCCGIPATTLPPGIWRNAPSGSTRTAPSRRGLSSCASSTSPRSTPSAKRCSSAIRSAAVRYSNCFAGIARA